MVYHTLAQRLDNYELFYDEVYLRKQEKYQKLVHYPPLTDAVILTCSDSRVVPSLTFLSEPGDEFVDQSIGNVFTENTAIAIRTGILLKNVQLIMVMGHSDCLAMKCCLNPESVDPCLGIHRWVEKHSKRAHRKAQEVKHNRIVKPQQLALVTEENILDQVAKARRCIKRLSKATARPDLVTNTLVVGLYFDLISAELHVYKDWNENQPQWLDAKQALKQLR